MFQSKAAVFFLGFLLLVLPLRAQWLELGGNNSIQANGNIKSIAIDHAGNLYTAGEFVNAFSKSYVAKWAAASNSWTELGGINSLQANGYINCIATDPSGNIYVAGDFSNAAGKQYVAKWTAATNAWSELGGNNSLQANDAINCITVDLSGSVYVAGAFTNTLGKQYVAKWNSTTDTWVELGGINALHANNNIRSITIDPAGNIYAAGDFYNSSFLKYYVAKWSVTHNTWSELGGNNSLQASSYIYSITSDHSGNIYAAGYFTNSSGNRYVAKWTATINSWSELGGNNSLQANSYIYSIVVDSSSGDVYAAGKFKNSSGKPYLAKWSSVLNTWSELGGSNALMANNNILSAAIDLPGSLYVGGWFTNASGENYIAKFSPILDSVDSINVRTINNVAAVITTNAGTLPIQAQVYPASAGQGVTWTVTSGTGTATISSTGIVSAVANGTVWAKAVSTTNPAIKDSLLIVITNQAIPVDSINVHTINSTAASITTNAGTLLVQAQVYPISASQAVTWSIVPGTGMAATISSTGIVSAIANGTVWAKATSVVDSAVKDSIMVTITNQGAGTGIVTSETVSAFKIYPNPANKFLSVETSLPSQDAMLKIYSVTGMPKLTKQLKNGKAKLDLSTLPAGLYFLKYWDGSNQGTTKFEKR